jgi:hypothetical protein
MIEQSIAGKSFLYRNRERNGGLVLMTTSNRIPEPSVNVLGGQEQSTIDSHEIEILGWTSQPIISNRRKISGRKVPQAGNSA